jgi:RNA polymerase sigma factor (sigma-70 family)
MTSKNNLADAFETNRRHMSSVAYRMLGSRAEADDAVQEAWLRLDRADASDIANMRGWLTTVIARICLDMLRSRKSRREDVLPEEDGDLPDDQAAENVERDLVIADSVGIALLVVLEALTPAERVAFVLHDMFDLPFEDIAPVVGRNAAATRQLASRARRRVRGAPAAPADSDRRREVVDAFLAASRGGDFTALLTVLDPDVVYRADPAAMLLGAQAELRGAESVAKAFQGRAQSGAPAFIDGHPGLVIDRDGAVLLVLLLAIDGDRITAVDAVADRERITVMRIDRLTG